MLEQETFNSTQELYSDWKIILRIKNILKIASFNWKALEKNTRIRKLSLHNFMVNIGWFHLE